MARTGLGLSTYYSASKVAWMFDEYPDVRLKCEAGAAAFGTIDTWLIWNLTNGSSHVTDSSNAGRTMVFNVAENRWDDYLLDALNLPRPMLPRVLPSNGEFGGAVNPAEVFSRPIPIRACLGDQQSAVFGQGCFDDGQAKCTMGTCLNLGVNSSKLLITDSGITPSIGWNLDGKLTYNLEGGVYVGGSLLAWLQEQLGMAASFDELVSCAASVSDSGGVYFVPAFVGLGAPHWDQNARGLIIGLSFNHDKRHLLRAAIDSLAFQVWDVISVMRKTFGLSLTTLRVDGGASKNDFLMQVLADITQCSIERPTNVDRTPMGAVSVAGLACGIWKDRKDLSRLWTLDSVFEPKTNRRESEKALDGWLRAVERAKGWIDE
jgi:glycerol kinase